LQSIFWFYVEKWFLSVLKTSLICMQIGFSCHWLQLWYKNVEFEIALSMYLNIKNLFSITYIINFFNLIILDYSGFLRLAKTIIFIYNFINIICMQIVLIFFKYLLKFFIYFEIKFVQKYFSIVFTSLSMWLLNIKSISRTRVRVNRLSLNNTVTIIR